MKDMIDVKIKRLNSDAFIPVQKTAGSAGFDAKIPETIEIHYGRQIIPLGISFEMPPFMRMDCRSRSGYSSKGLLVVDEFGNETRINADVTLGLIDSDYRGEVGVILHVKDWRVLKPWKAYFLVRGQSIAQLVFSKVPNVVLGESHELSSTKRGKKGFGGADGE